MKKTPLDRLAMPRTSLSFALQSLASAQRRWRQMIPGSEPVAPPGEEVSHYSGRQEDAVPGGAPESPIGKMPDKSTSKKNEDVSEPRPKDRR
ncbi:hypothetical protein ACQKH5_06340 [Hyphomonas sp. NPDC076900]|uniref:hypothetical protein n=1 Tax=unclassified Hyphomonas TaxID=2630699 RepID=UPI003D05D3BB